MVYITHVFVRAMIIFRIFLKALFNIHTVSCNVHTNSDKAYEAAFINIIFSIGVSRCTDIVLLMSYLFNKNLRSNNMHLTVKASETDWSVYVLVFQS